VGTSPSLSARRLAAQRLRLARTRPSTPGADTDGEDRLYRAVAGRVRAARASDAVALRTRAIDREVARALGRGVAQVVLVGAGYDGRALRFARDGAPPARWFELDAPAPLAHKGQWLRSHGLARPPAVVAVGLELARDDVGAALEDAGQVTAHPSLFVCEDALSALSLEAAGRLCRGLRDRAGQGSVLVAAFVVAPPAGAAVRTWRAGTDLLRTAVSGTRRHAFHPGDPDKLLVVTGWRVLGRERSDASAPDRAVHTEVLVAEPDRPDGRG
jgi:methyltransferase (TIGR00027 family)